MASRPVDSQWWNADDEFIEATVNWTHYTDSSASDNLRKTAFVALAVYGVVTTGRKKALTLLLVFALSCSLPLTRGLTRYLLPG